MAVIENMTHCYGENILFMEADLEIERGDRIAFVGPNGAGKSTLLRLIMGVETPEEGSARLGEHNVIASYFEQNQAEALDLNKTVIETMFEAVPDWTQTQVRSLLGSFCFSNDSVFKDVGKLSGGEKARLALALMLLSPCNLLVLDEPTNHLDSRDKEADGRERSQAQSEQRQAKRTGFSQKERCVARLLSDRKTKLHTCLGRKTHFSLPVQTVWIG